MSRNKNTIWKAFCLVYSKELVYYKAVKIRSKKYRGTK